MLRAGASRLRLALCVRDGRRAQSAPAASDGLACVCEPFCAISITYCSRFSRLRFCASFGRFDQNDASDWRWLTNMSTATILVTRLVGQGALLEWQTELGSREHGLRALYVTRRVETWAETILPGLSHTGAMTGLTCAEQLYARAHDFIVGRPLLIDREFHILDPASKGIWELKTADLRLFGWFPYIDCFICDAIATKHQIEVSGLYRGYVDQTYRVRLHLGFRRGLYVASGEPRHVVSYCD